MPSKCIVLDIETVPDHRACLVDKNLEFEPPIFHKIVCLSYALLDNDFKLQTLGVLGLNILDEDHVLRYFGSLVDDDTLVVTWSGRRFDIPVILYRSMKHGIPCKWAFSKEFDKRFGLSGHIDLQDHMTLYGATERIKLDHAATLVGLPGKLDTEGSMVSQLWAKNRFTDIGIYCATDVVQTAVLFVRWAHLRGLASTEELSASLKSIAGYGSAGYVNCDIPRMCAIEGIRKVMANCDWDSLSIRDLNKEKTT